MSESTGTSTQQNTQGLTDAQLRAVLDEYALAKETDVQSNSQKLDTISSAVAANGEKIDGVSASVASDAASVVLIDSTQWGTMASKWDTLAQSMQVVLFLALVVTLLLAALFGNRLWSAFSRGWRN